MSNYKNYDEFDNGKTFEKFKLHSSKGGKKHSHKKVKPREKQRANKYY